MTLSAPNHSVDARRKTLRRAGSGLTAVRRGSRSELEEADIHPRRSKHHPLRPATGGELPVMPRHHIRKIQR